MPTAGNKIAGILKNLSPRIYWRELLALLMLLLAIVFFRDECRELHQLIPELKQVSIEWLFLLAALSIATVACQGGIYRSSFAAIGLLLKFGYGMGLFLKRNFLSVFLPAGGVSALAYAPREIRRAEYTKIQVHQASGLFAFAGLLSFFIVAIPIISYAVTTKNQFGNSWIGLVIILLLMTIIVGVVQSLRKKKFIYQYIEKKFPQWITGLQELFTADLTAKKYSGAVLYSAGVELCGILTVYTAMLALGQPASLGAAASAYVISVLITLISPFMRGLGAVELSMVYVLEQFGYSSVTAFSITIIYRVFEFWVPLISGFFSFAWRGRKIFLRLFPAVLIFTLGIINIVSAVTPPLQNRFHFLREYIPLTAIHASHLLVLFCGLALLVTATFLFRGLRTAWIIALLLSAFSVVGNLTKALDYEEALFAIVTFTILAFTATQYRIRSSNKWMKAGLKTALLGFGSVLVFGTISFYFIDINHFGEDFTWQQSLVHTLKSFLLVEDHSLRPFTRFGHEFVWLLRSLGFLLWSFLLFCIIKPHQRRHNLPENHRERALFLVKQFGDSSMDYFKVYKDKLIFLSDVSDGFVAYRIAGGFAIVLEEPVCAEENKLEILQEFEQHCRRMGLKPAFYRVDEDSIPWFNQLRKNKLMIGQEAIIDINSFSLEGKDRKSLRNGLSSLQKKGYTTTLHTFPHTADFLKKLKCVSDEWLQTFAVEETVFSQGMFDELDLQQQDIITVTDENGAIKAFLNIIPDYAEEDCTYDLIRKTTDAPGAAMDALIVRLIEYARDNKKRYINLGLVPMTGITQPDSTAEQLIKLAAQKIKRFQHYKGLRDFKEKYASFWENKYLVYDNDFDLLQLPVALHTAMKP